MCYTFQTYIPFASSINHISPNDKYLNLTVGVKKKPKRQPNSFEPAV